jgi:hypothetical protein
MPRLCPLCYSISGLASCVRRSLRCATALNPVPSMTQPTLTRSFLKHSQPLLTKCLQAALIAGPLLLAAAPSEAVSVKTTVNGFTGEFAPEVWAKSPTSVSLGNSSVVTNSAITLTKNAANSTSTSATVTLTDSLFENLKPSGAGRILSWQATGLYDWTTTGSATNTRYNFRARVPDTKLNPTSGTGNLTDVAFTLGQSYDESPFDPDDPSQLRFSIARTLSAATSGTGTGVIDNFQFVANYDVPGPLPVVGAAAAFAWSRRLRKRLNSAKTLA